MNRALHAASWFFFSVTMYLIFQAIALRWIRLPSIGDIGFTLAFVLFAVTHCIALEGLRRTALFFSVSAVVSFCMEEVGVRTGIVYGAYHYSDLLGAKLGHVPVLIPLAWFMMIYPSWMVARALIPGIDTRSIAGLTALAAIAAIVMTSWDVVMDPGMAAAGNWTWEHGGAWFGVPRRNYLGWLFTTFPVYWIAGWLWRNSGREAFVSRAFKTLPIVVYAFLALRYVATNRFPALQMIAIFCMGLPSLLALIQLFLNTGASQPDSLPAS